MIPVSTTALGNAKIAALKNLRPTDGVRRLIEAAAEEAEREARLGAQPAATLAKIRDDGDRQHVAREAAKMLLAKLEGAR